MALRRSPERHQRQVALTASYAALIATVIFAYLSSHAHVGIIAIIPLLFIAYYARLSVALVTAAFSGALLAFLDRDVFPGGAFVHISPAADALSFVLSLCVVVFVAERLRISSLQNTTLREHLQQALTQAERDSLTGVPNRAFFLQQLRACIRAMTANEHVGVLFADLDGFKAVNDRAGHIAGDRVLVHAAERLRHTIRTNDVLARLGGDEFVILIAHLHDRTEADALTEKIEAQFTDPFSVDNAEFRVGVTIGVSIAPQDGLDPNSLLRIADQRMYDRKEAKRRPRVTISTE
jgi:diguanylate cyclase (GGDEF)-like protein